jgi:hypothetical protein
MNVYLKLTLLLLLLWSSYVWAHPSPLLLHLTVETSGVYVQVFTFSGEQVRGLRLEADLESNGYTLAQLALHTRDGETYHLAFPSAFQEGVTLTLRDTTFPEEKSEVKADLDFSRRDVELVLLPSPPRYFSQPVFYLALIVPIFLITSTLGSLWLAQRRHASKILRRVQ